MGRAAVAVAGARLHDRRIDLQIEAPCVRRGDQHLGHGDRHDVRLERADVGARTDHAREACAALVEAEGPRIAAVVDALAVVGQGDRLRRPAVGRQAGGGKPWIAGASVAHGTRASCRVLHDVGIAGSDRAAAIGMRADARRGAVGEDRAGDADGATAPGRDGAAAIAPGCARGLRVGDTGALAAAAAPAVSAGGGRHADSAGHGGAAPTEGAASVRAGSVARAAATADAATAAPGACAGTRTTTAGAREPAAAAAGRCTGGSAAAAIAGTARSAGRTAGTAARTGPVRRAGAAAVARRTGPAAAGVGGARSAAATAATRAAATAARAGGGATGGAVTAPAAEARVVGRDRGVADRQRAGGGVQDGCAGLRRRHRRRRIRTLAHPRRRRRRRSASRSNCGW